MSGNQKPVENKAPSKPPKKGNQKEPKKSLPPPKDQFAEIAEMEKKTAEAEADASGSVGFEDPIEDVDTPSSNVEVKEEEDPVEEQSPQAVSQSPAVASPTPVVPKKPTKSMTDSEIQEIVRKSLQANKSGAKVNQAYVDIAETWVMGVPPTKWYTVVISLTAFPMDVDLMDKNYEDIKGKSKKWEKENDRVDVAFASYTVLYNELRPICLKRNTTFDEAIPKSSHIAQVPAIQTYIKFVREALMKPVPLVPRCVYRKFYWMTWDFEPAMQFMKKKWYQVRKALLAIRSLDTADINAKHLSDGFNLMTTETTAQQATELAEDATKDPQIKLGVLLKLVHVIDVLVLQQLPQFKIGRREETDASMQVANEISSWMFTIQGLVTDKPVAATVLSFDDPGVIAYRKALSDIKNELRLFKNRFLVQRKSGAKAPALKFKTPPTSQFKD